MLSLTTGGSIQYIGEGSQGFLGILDASECPPTFGAGELVLVYCLLVNYLLW